MKKHPKRTLEHASRNSLRLVMFESAITEGLLCMSVMSPFFLSIGLSQAEIAASQAIFTIFTVLLNLPTGWLADRFSHKWANVIGDLGHALVLLGYSTAQTFHEVIIYETLAAVFLSLSAGVDMSLLKHFSSQLDSSGELFRTKTAKLAVWKHACTLILVLLGGPIGAISFRLAIAASSIPYLLGGIAALFIRDDSAKLVATYKNPLRDMWRIVRTSLRNPELRLRIATYAIGREMSHAVIWIFTPMLLLVGVPLPIVPSAWALNSLACIFGAKLAARVAAKLREWQIFAVPLALMAISMGILSVNLNIFTVWFYLLMGVVQGWTSATLSPLVQRYAKPDEQTSVLSFTGVVSKALYVPVIWATGWLADFSLQYATLLTLVVFGTLGSIILVKLLRK